jgi:hypothetical protein
MKTLIGLPCSTASLIFLPILSQQTSSSLATQKLKVHENERHKTYDIIQNDPHEASKEHEMLSSSLLNFLVMASFTLTAANAAALKPRAAAAKSNKVCSNAVYSSPQCCIPNENGLDKPDCITRKLLPFSFPYSSSIASIHLIYDDRFIYIKIEPANEFFVDIAASAATASDLKASCAYGEKSEAMCCSVPSVAGVEVSCMPL